jgi:O-antigen biosynthesis protein
MPDSPRPCTIIIPTYNGRDILEECLPSVAAEIERRGGIDELLIVDNASSDGTGGFIAATYPSARVLRLESNMAIFALNPAAAAASHRHLFFLNNDMLLEPGCIDALLSGFVDENVFAVTGKVFQWDRRTVQAGRRRAFWRRGMFWFPPWPGAEDEPGPTLHALGGQSVFDRDKFLELGGIDPLFSPFYHEDLDISWRAYRNGWRVLYEPRAVMIHKGAATAGRMYSRRELDIFMRKNMFLFIWKNIHGPGMLASHIAWLPPHCAAALLKRDTVFARGLLGALRQAPAAARARKLARDNSTVPDSDVLAILGPGR